jgi:phosphoribosylglycinamide formyltransferase-1
VIKTPVGILISGRGSNMEALIDAASAPDYPARIAIVLSNNPDASGLETARQAGIAAIGIDHRPFGKDRAAHEHQIDRTLRAAGVELVCLAGYMRVLTPFLVDAWAGRMLNVHPSLLPAYPGLNTHARALAAGDLEAGCTVHLVTAGVDEGPILGQAKVLIGPDETDVSLARRVLAAEHQLYSECLARLIVQRNAPAAPNE